MGRMVCLFQSQRDRATNQAYTEYDEFFQKKILKNLKAGLYHAGATSSEVGMITVSYTHLDVYKRQALAIAQIALL